MVLKMIAFELVAGTSLNSDQNTYDRRSKQFQDFRSN